MVLFDQPPDSRSVRLELEINPKDSVPMQPGKRCN